MLCPAAVTAAVAAVWLLAALGPGLCCFFADDSEPDFTLCSHSFYRQTPPQGASAGPLLRPLCHRLPGGQAFATLSRPTCDTAVYSAYHLSHGWEEGEGGEPVTEEEGNIEVAVPALLRRDKVPSNSVSPEESPFQQWDSTVTTLIQSSISPKCSPLGGDLYILTGSGGLGAVEDGDEKCQTRPLWAAVCCTIPEGKGGFSMGLIGESEEGVREVSVKELEEILGVSELFSEGCGGADGEAVAVILGFPSQDAENAQNTEADAPEEEADADADSGISEQYANEYVQESTEASTTQEQVADVDAHSEESDDADVKTQASYAADDQSEESDDADSKTQELYAAADQSEESEDSDAKTEEAYAAADQLEEPKYSDAKTQESYAAADQSEESDDAVSNAQKSYAAYSEDSDDDTQKTSSDPSTSESSRDTQQDEGHSRAARSKSPESSGDDKTVDEEETKTNTSSTLVYIISTTVSVLKAPLRPLFNRITEFPGQVIYVLQEDLGVLSGLPGDTYNLFHLLISDTLSWVRSAAETLFGVGNNCFCCAYFCSSSILGALLDHCYTGVMGMVTLAGDTLGIFGGAVDNTWWVTKLFGGRLWERSKGYVGTVASEMGGQAQAVGGGLGRLTWSSGSTVGKVFRLIWDFITGVLDIVFGAVRIAFGRNSE